MILNENVSISIIIPLYNVEKYIERCLESIVCQTFSDFEVILIDDASPDASLKIAESYLTQNNISFKSIIHQQNRKQGAARNNGLRIAKGRYILFVDADDELSCNYVLDDYFKIICTDRYDFVESNFYTKSKDESKKQQEFTKPRSKIGKIESENILSLLLDNKLSISPCSKLISKNFLLSNHIYFPEGIYFEDNLWAFILYKKATKIYCSPMYSYIYYLSNPLSTTTAYKKEKLDDLQNVITAILDIIDDEELCTDQKPNLLRSFIMRFVDGLLYRAATPKDKGFWMKYFKQLEKGFKKSSLSEYEPFFYMQPLLLYYLYKERRRIDQRNFFMTKLMYQGFLRIMFLYAFAGARAVIRKIGDKIS